MNESALRDSPYKLISCTIEKLQINNLSLNLLAQPISIDAKNVRVVDYNECIDRHNTDAGG